MTNLINKTIKVIVVLDGRPGHEKQSLGIVNGLAKRLRVEKNLIDVSKRTLREQVFAYLSFLTNKKYPDSLLPRDASLVIGTGSRTHSTVLAIKKELGIPAVTCMTPGNYLRDMFDLCFVPEHDGCSKRRNFVFTTGAPNVLVDRNQHQGDKGLILLGGVDKKSHVWDDQDIANKVRLILSRDTTTKWTISSSPRTPQSTVESIENLALKTDNAEFFDYKNTHKGWVEEKYDESTTVWVTSDSISMLYEALTAGCRVNIIPMKWLDKKSKFKRNEDILVQKGLVVPFSDWEQGRARQLSKQQLNEAQRCADYMIKKWWPENLQ